MSGSIVCSVIAPHSPRMGNEETAPDFTRGLIQGLRDLGAKIRAAEPDAIIVCSTHWVTTFNWYLTAAARQTGECIAEEAPDMFPPIPYDRPGDPALANAIAAEIEGLGVPAATHDIDHYNWDYGSCIPIRYIDEAETIPVVTMGTCLMADLDECMAVGGAVRKAVEASGKRVAFIASSALSHALVRGPDIWPTDERRAMDDKLIKLLSDGEIGAAKNWFPTFAKDAVAEMSGRPIAVMLGTLDETHSYSGSQIGAYGQSSGSGNASVFVMPG